MSDVDLNAAGAADLAVRLGAAGEAAAAVAGEYAWCTEDSLGEGSALQPAYEYGHFTESWTAVLRVTAQDLGAAAQLFGGLSSHLDQLDSSIRMQ